MPTVKPQRATPVTNPDGSLIGSGGGSGGAITAADGAIVTQGITTDTAYPGTGAGTLVALLKGIFGKLAGTLNIGSANLETIFSTSASQAVASTDVTGYRSVSVHITSQGTGSTVTFQVSNDNVNWLPYTLVNAATGASQAVQSSTTTSAGVIFAGMLPARYFRLNVSGISAGVTAGVIEFSPLPLPLLQLTVTNPAGANIGVAASQSGGWSVQPIPATTGGLTAYRNLWPANTNGANMKTTAGTLYDIHVGNSATTPRYLKLYNKATAPAVATDTPIHTFMIPASYSGPLFNSTFGISFAAGIGLVVTTGVADTDANAPAANDVIINAGYK